MQKEELASKRPLVPSDIELEDNQREVLDTFTVAASLGRSALGAYVISMASSPSDILAVVLLQKEARLQSSASRRSAFPRSLHCGTFTPCACRSCTDFFANGHVFAAHADVSVDVLPRMVPRVTRL